MIAHSTKGIQTILFRVDASSALGMGHFMRCLSLAVALKSRGIDPVFISSELPTSLASILHTQQIACRSLNVEAGSDTDLQATCEQLSQDAVAALVLDGYHFSVTYRQTLYSNRKSMQRVIVFDDLNDIPELHCDIVINSVSDATLLGYEQTAPDALHLIGMQYAIVRQSFLDAKALPASNDLWINFGGSDPLGITSQVLCYLLQQSAIDAPGDIHVVVGTAFLQSEMIADYCRKIQLKHGVSVHFHQQPEHYEPLMKSCSLALVAPGSCVYELAFCHVPAVFIPVADNQRISLKSQLELGWCEAVNDASPSSVEQAINMVMKYWHDDKKLMLMREKLSGIIDGKGVERLAEAIVNEVEHCADS